MASWRSQYEVSGQLPNGYGSSDPYSSSYGSPLSYGNAPRDPPSYAVATATLPIPSSPSNPCNTNCLAFLAAATTIGLIVVNILALYGYLNTQTLSIVNTSTLGVASCISFNALCKSGSSDKHWKKLALLTAGVVLIACAGLASLGIFKVFNTTSVTWTVFAPVIATSAMALMLSLGVAITSREEKEQWIAGTV